MLGSRSTLDGPAQHPCLRWGRLDVDLIEVRMPHPTPNPEWFDLRLLAQSPGQQDALVRCEVDDLFDLVDVLRGENAWGRLGQFLPPSIRHDTPISHERRKEGSRLVVAGQTFDFRPGELRVVGDDLRTVCQHIIGPLTGVGGLRGPARTLAQALTDIDERPYPIQAPWPPVSLSTSLFGQRAFGV